MLRDRLHSSNLFADTGLIGSFFHMVLGLVMQPVVGVLSDKCTSKLGRRRPFLIVGVAAVVVSFLCLGWCREIIRGIFGEQYPNVLSMGILHSLRGWRSLSFSKQTIRHLNVNLAEKRNNLNGCGINIHPRLCDQLR